MILIVAFCPFPNKLDSIPFVSSLKKGKLLITTIMEPNIVNGNANIKESRKTIKYRLSPHQFAKGMIFSLSLSIKPFILRHLLFFSNRLHPYNITLTYISLHIYIQKYILIRMVDSTICTIYGIHIIERFLPPQ